MKKFKILYQENRKLKRIILEESELKSFIKDNNVISIKESKNLFEYDFRWSFKKHSFINLIEELSTMLEANLSFEDSINILSKNCKNKDDKKLLDSIENSLKSGIKISTSLKKFEDKIGKVGLLFFKIAEESSSLKEVFSLYYSYLFQMDKIRAKLSKALKYPLILLCALMIAFFIIFYAVLPQFQTLFMSMNAELSLATKLLIFTKEYFIYLIGLIIVVIFLIFIWIKSIKESNEDNQKKFDKMMLTKIPIFSTIVRNYNNYLVFLELRIFLQNNYKFQTALQQVISLQNNKYILDTILTINNKMRNGVTLYTAFKDSALFDEIALRQLYVGEVSNTLEKSILNIERYYYKLLNKKIENFISLIEPIFFIFISLFILWIVLALFVPMWNMSTFLNI